MIMRLFGTLAIVLVYADIRHLSSINLLFYGYDLITAFISNEDHLSYLLNEGIVS